MRNMLKTAALAAAAACALSAAASADGLKDAKDVKVTFVVHGSASDPYWSVVKRGVDDAAALTGAQIDYYNPQVFDVVEQARLLDAAIAAQAGRASPCRSPTPTRMRDGVTKARRRRHPGGGGRLRRGAGSGDGRDTYVGTVSEYDSGKKAGERLAKEGVLKVVCINHEVGNVSLDQRCQGLNDGLKPSGGGTEVVAVTPDPADIQRRTEAYLVGAPDVQAIFAMGAGAANPLIPLFRDQELFGKMKLYTFDISPEVLDSIIAGEMGFGMDAQQYLMGYLPVIYLVRARDERHHGRSTTTYTGPLFVDTPDKAKAILTLAKEGIR